MTHCICALALLLSVALAHAADRPPAPLDLRALARDGEVALAWKPVDGASTYSVKHATTSGGPYKIAAHAEATTAHVVQKLKNGLRHYFVVSAVGPETDFTIADFVADVRALTPTDAGNLVVPDVRELGVGLRSLAGRLGQGLLKQLSATRERLDAVARSYAFRRPLDRIRAREQRLDDVCQRLVRDIDHALKLENQRLEALAGRLESLSPLAVLSRGYSVTFNEPAGSPRQRSLAGTLVRDARTLKSDDRVRTRLAKGEFVARVEEVVRAAPRRKTRGTARPARKR